jgi:hypothetical protein
MWDARLLTPAPSSHAACRDRDSTLESNHHRIKKTKKMTFETFRAAVAPIDVCKYHMYLIEIKK